MEQKFNNFSEFYAHYLEEHQNPMNRRMHYLGSVLGAFFFLLFLMSGSIILLIVAFIVGYGLAWSGHYFFEKNKPLSFKHPLYSFMADWVMFKDMLSGKIKF